MAPNFAHYYLSSHLFQDGSAALQCQRRFGTSTVRVIPIFYQATYAEGFPSLIFCTILPTLNFFFSTSLPLLLLIPHRALIVTGITSTLTCECLQARDSIVYLLFQTTHYQENSKMLVTEQVLKLGVWTCWKKNFWWKKHWSEEASTHWDSMMLSIGQKHLTKGHFISWAHTKFYGLDLMLNDVNKSVFTFVKKSWIAKEEVCNKKPKNTRRENEENKQIQTKWIWLFYTLKSFLIF